MASFIDTTVEDIRRRVGEGRAVCGLSGGVDSSVAAALVDKAIGDRQTCIFVDTGLLRKNEFEEVLEAYRDMHLNVVGVAAGARPSSPPRPPPHTPPQTQNHAHPGTPT